MSSAFYLVHSGPCGVRRVVESEWVTLAPGEEASEELTGTSLSVRQTRSQTAQLACRWAGHGVLCKETVVGSSLAGRHSMA